MFLGRMDTRVMTPRPVAGWRLARATNRDTSTVLILLLLISRYSLYRGLRGVMCSALHRGDKERKIGNFTCHTVTDTGHSGQA